MKWFINVAISEKIRLLLLSSLCLLLSGCTTANWPDIQQMFMNIGQSLPPIWSMIVGLSYVFGMFFMLRGVYALKVYGDMRTQMSSSSSIKTPLIMFTVGTALMFLPTTRAVMLTTIFAYSDPMPLSYFTSNPIWSGQTTQILLQIVQLVGLIAFVRGWVYLAQTQSHNPGQHTFGKAVTHIIGGIVAINIEGTREVLMGTLGISG